MGSSYPTGKQNNVRVSHVAEIDLPLLGATDGPEPLLLLSLVASTHEGDNFEGMAVYEDELDNSGCKVWIISDDNFNPSNQRTLLYEFWLSYGDLPTATTALPAAAAAAENETTPRPSDIEESSTGAIAIALVVMVVTET